MPRHASFEHRFRRSLSALDILHPDAHLLVAVSGGLDSVSLLHLLRFAAGPAAPRISAVHFDHAMRTGSAADARWVAGLCKAWSVPLVSARSTVPLRSETEARRERHAFLREAATQAGATHIATAHHADDQAETVLFRILRGTGVPGLGGIAPVTPSGLVRPLLPFWRSEIERYARAGGLRWRVDPTNRSLHPARNWLRHILLPRIERKLAPAARRNLVRLAELSREAESGWEAVLQPLESQVARLEHGAIVLARQPFRTYHPALRSRLVRRLLSRLGLTPAAAGTRMAVQFITDAPSGRQLQLPGGVRLLTEYDEVRIAVAREPGPGEFLLIPEASDLGRGELRLPDRCYRVRWAVATEPPEWFQSAAAWQAALDPSTLAFPLRLRSWMPGDRIRLHAGSRRLKKLFGDRRIPRSERARRPVLVDARGEVLWVAGVVQGPTSLPRAGWNALFLTIFHG